MLLKFPEDPEEQRNTLKQIAKLLSEDKVGAIPTETIYGLACNPFSERALEKLFHLKQREPNKPILLLLGKMEDLFLVVKYIPTKARILMKHYWPGPLTIVLPARKSLPKLLTGGLETIGVRLTSNEIARKIAWTFGKPVTGTSANISGDPPCRSAEEVLKVFPHIDFVVDGGVCESITPSTVVEIIDNEVKLIREGVIPFSEILHLLEEEGR